MEKAYDFVALGKKLQAKGLTIAEGAVESAGKAAYEAAKEWFVESATLSATPIDNLVIPFMGEIDKVVLPALGKIDLDGDGK